MLNMTDAEHPKAPDSSRLILAFGVLFGPLGVLLATPLAVVCFVLVKKLWVRETLHEEVDLPGEADSDESTYGQRSG